MRRLLAAARAVPAGAALVAAMLVACGNDSTAPSSTPTPFFTGGSGASATSAAATPPTNTPPGSTPPVTTPPANTPVPAGGNAGSATIDGARYAFAVRTCTVINGQYYLVGDGDVSVALASMLILQTTGRGSFMVDDPVVAARGATLTVSGTARNLVLSGDRVEVSLTAPCPGLAN